MLVEIILGLFLTFILFCVGYYAAKASSKVGSISGYSKDSNMDAAYVALTWAAFICWFTVGIFVVGFLLFIASFFFGVGEAITAESVVTTASGSGNILLNVFNGFLVLLIFIIGALSIKGAIDIKKSTLYSGSNDAKDAYDAAIYASVISMISIAVLIGLWIYTIYSKKQKQKAERERAMKLAAAKKQKRKQGLQENILLAQAKGGLAKNYSSLPAKLE